MEKIRHSILVVSYNQEEYINASLDSLIGQSVRPDEIIVGDDSSTDRTWGIILEYVREYPGLIKAYRNEFNLGLFQNFNKIKRLATGDMISYLAGDDLLDQDFIKNVNGYLEDNKIDEFSEKFIVITNSLVIENQIVTYCNNFQYRTLPVLKSLIRGNLKIWDTGMSRGLFHSMPDWRTDMGNHADSLQFFERFLMSGRAFFVPSIGYKYRKNVGVTARADLEHQNNSYLAVLQAIMKEGDGVLDETDIHYMEFLIAYYNYILDPSFGNYVTFLASRLKKSDIPSDSVYNRPSVYLPIKLKQLFKKILLRKGIASCPTNGSR